GRAKNRRSAKAAARPPVRFRPGAAPPPKVRRRKNSGLARGSRPPPAGRRCKANAPCPNPSRKFLVKRLARRLATTHEARAPLRRHHRQVAHDGRYGGVQKHTLV